MTNDENELRLLSDRELSAYLWILQFGERGLVVADAETSAKRKLHLRLVKKILRGRGILK